MRATLLVGLVLAMAACGATTSSLTPGGENTAANNMICIGDPDRGGVVCQPAGEIWDCLDLPNGDRKCSRPGDSPDGSARWDCRHDGSHVVCTSSVDATGASGWDCVADKGNTSCVSTNASDVPGAGHWRCTVDREFAITCQTDDGESEEGNETNPGPIGAGDSTCFCPPPDAKAQVGEGPIATITTQETTYDGVAALRAQLTFSTAFNDNTYGVNSSPCWSDTKKGHHEFKQLVGSDAAEILFTCDGELVLGAKIDYISESSSASGYGSLCVDGGDGKLTAGDAGDVLGCETSLDVNFNTHDHVLTTDSPPFDDYKPSAPYDQWIYEVWYAVWVRKDALSGSCKVSINYVHASPACGGENSIDVVPCPC